VRTLSTSRLKKYLETGGANIDTALTGYERNTRLSEAFYTPLQCLEICLRNVIHSRMAEFYGSDWMTNDYPPLAESSKEMIKASLTELQKTSEWPSNDDIVSELKFAFWVGLLGPGYDESLWRKTLFHGFSVGGRRKRKTVHARFNAIRRFRNRVAHHEPIFHRDIISVHEEIIEAIGWMCSDTASWARHVSRLPAVHAEE